MAEKLAIILVIFFLIILTDTEIYFIIILNFNSQVLINNVFLLFEQILYIY